MNTAAAIIWLVVLCGVVYFMIRELLTLRDKCQVCGGKCGGVRGNENIVNGVIVCDYCHAKMKS